MNLHKTILDMGERAQVASRALATVTTEQKNRILKAMALALDVARSDIKTANEKDLEAAKEQKLSAALLDRLTLTDARIDAMIEGFHQVITLKDPVGTILGEISKENGLLIRKKRVPIGVIAMIYESRPNVTADVAALCLKSGNAIILRGGAEAINTNQAIANALIKAGQSEGLPNDALQLVSTTDRDAVRELVRLEGKVDLVIPRGGEGLIRAVSEMARVPVIKHYKGLCHIYVDASSDIEKAVAICENAKCQRPGVCNAVETLLVHEKIAPAFLPKLAERLKKEKVELRGDKNVCEILKDIKMADEKDWDTEYLDLILSIKTVENVKEAIDHINKHGSHHSDAIISDNEVAQTQFLNEVDSAAVYVNASTRFTDGAEFGMGAEIGISTDKLHARGPMGLEELTTYKYIILGDGQVRT